MSRAFGESFRSNKTKKRGKDLSNTNHQLGISQEIQYTDEQFDKEFPERLVACEHCKKKFPTRFNAKYCSDSCFKKSIKALRKKLGTWVKHEKRIKSTHRPDKNWKDPQ